MDQSTERMYQLMRKESNRLKTFQMNPPWPKDYVDIKKLAKAGFFYAFNGDNVHCAFCRGQVCRWDRDDDPMTEHSRHFTTCPFIMGGEVGNEPIGDDPFPGPKRARPYDVCGAFPNFPSNDPRYDPEQEGQSNQIPTSDPDSHPTASARQSRSNLRTDNQPQSGSPQHQEQIQASIEHTNQLQQPSVYSLIPPIEPQVTMPTDGNQVRNYLIYQHLRNQDTFNQQQHVISSSNIGYSNQSNDPPSNNLNGICKICYTNAIELVFLPCGHSVSCLSCAQRLHNCPFCRELITTRIRTYLV